MLLHHAEEGDAEDIAGDSFAEADGEGVVEERGREAVADACFLPSDERADEDGVAEHGRQRRGPLIAAAGGEERGEQRGRRADDHVERAVGAQDVREHAADEQSPACLGHQERQNRHRLGKAELDGAVGKVQGVGEHRQRDVDGRDERAAGELFGVKVHGSGSFLKSCGWGGNG